jgi:hypothetical protein
MTETTPIPSNVASLRIFILCAFSYESRGWAVAERFIDVFAKLSCNASATHQIDHSYAVERQELQEFVVPGDNSGKAYIVMTQRVTPRHRFLLAGFGHEGFSGWVYQTVDKRSYSKMKGVQVKTVG